MRSEAVIARNTLFTCFVLLVALCQCQYSAAQTVTLVSVSTSGEQANNSTQGEGLSANGKIVLLVSQATNLAIPDVNGANWDLFVRDLEASTTTFANVNSDGEQGSSQYGRISVDGRYVVFSSSSRNMPGASGNVHRAYLHDRTLGETELISLSTSGQPANAPSGAGSVTPNGRFATFGTDATDMVRTPYQGAQLFMRDRQTGETFIITINSNGQPVESVIIDPPSGAYVSDDGRFVVFSNRFNDLMPGGTSNWRKIYLHDRLTIQTTLVSVPHDGVPLDGTCSQIPMISGDGRFVMFSSKASNLVRDDINGVEDIFVRDLLAQKTYRVSVSSIGEPANAACTLRAMSSNGRYYAFTSAATNLDYDDTNEFSDGFVHDLWTGTTEKVTYNWQGQGINASASVAGLSFDGRVVLMGSSGANVIQQPVNGLFTHYVRERWKLGDVNRDGVVNVVDLLASINAWGPCPAVPPPPALPIPCDADVTNDNSINVADLLLIINNWG